MSSPDSDTSGTSGTSDTGGTGTGGAGGTGNAEGRPGDAPTTAGQVPVRRTGTPDRPSAGAADVPGPVPPTTPERHGMFYARDTGDTSGYGGLVRPPYVPQPTERPYGGYFDDVADALADAMAERQIPPSAIEQITVANGEMTVYIAREHLVAMLQAMRDDEALRFEMASSVSGVDYGVDVPRRLHVVYELLSMTYRRRTRLEVAVDVDDATVPSATSIYPTADWHEREVWDMFGVVFTGHPALTRILMPDDWIGHPQRKDYPLGGIPVEYKGHEIPAPDQRRAYT